MRDDENAGDGFTPLPPMVDGRTPAEMAEEGCTRERPRVVCLCGSTRFKTEFIVANFVETMRGRIVLSVGFFSHADGIAYNLTDEEKARMDTLHLRKIDMADEVLVINVGGYIGESTRREVAYAMRSGKLIRWWTEER